MTVVSGLQHPESPYKTGLLVQVSAPPKWLTEGQAPKMVLVVLKMEP